MAVPHIFGFSFVALGIVLTGASQSFLRKSSSMSARYCSTLALVGLVRSLVRHPWSDNVVHHEIDFIEKPERVGESDEDLILCR